MRVRIVTGSWSAGAPAVAASLAARTAGDGARVICATITAASAVGASSPGIADLLTPLGATPVDLPSARAQPVRPTRGGRVGRGFIGLLTVDPRSIAERLLAERGHFLAEIVERAVRGPLAPLRDARPVVRLLQDSVTRAGATIALLEIVAASRVDGADDLVIAIAPPHGLSALTVEPDVLRRRIDALDALQAEQRHAARARGLRQGDLADAVLTRLASDLEELWSVLRQPGRCEAYLCVEADEAAIDATRDDLEVAARDALPLASLVVSAPVGRCDGCQEAARLGQSAASSARSLLDTVGLGAARVSHVQLASLLVEPSSLPAARTLAVELRRLGAMLLGEVTAPAGHAGLRSSRATASGGDTLVREALLPSIDRSSTILVAGDPDSPRGRLAGAAAVAASLVGPVELVDAGGGILAAVLEPDARPSLPPIRTLDPSLALESARKRLSVWLRQLPPGAPDPSSLLALIDLAPDEVSTALALAGSLPSAEVQPGRTIVDLGGLRRALSLLACVGPALEWLRALIQLVERWPGVEATTDLVSALCLPVERLLGRLSAPETELILLLPPNLPVGDALEPLQRVWRRAVITVRPVRRSRHACPSCRETARLAEADARAVRRLKAATSYFTIADLPALRGAARLREHAAALFPPPTSAPVLARAAARP